ncbi:hypothetical protein HZC31_05460 [Candidatus Woesearchaeota archaeon]|nr:hypothetical protein [Candidatus Woesearchaeota archaeon]
MQHSISEGGNYSLPISPTIHLARYVGILHGAGYVLQEGIAPLVLEQQLRDLAAANFPAANGYLPTCLKRVPNEDKISFFSALFFDLSSTSRAGHIVSLDTIGKEGSALLASYLGGFFSGCQDIALLQEYAQRLQQTSFPIFRQQTRTLYRP